MYKKQAFTLVEVILVVAILGLLTAIAVPNVMKARLTAQEKACQGNMAMIESAIEQWALDENKLSNTTVASGAQAGGWYDYLRGGALPACPAGGAYSYTGQSRSGGGDAAGTVGDYRVTCTVHGDAD
jgi:prepilin-type N-terminal cleavage/methylation domain-containing protein